MLPSCKLIIGTSDGHFLRSIRSHWQVTEVEEMSSGSLRHRHITRRHFSSRVMTNTANQLLISSSIIERLHTFAAHTSDADDGDPPAADSKLCFIGCLHGIFIEKRSKNPVVLNITGKTLACQDLPQSPTIEFFSDVFPVGIDPVGVVFASDADDNGSDQEQNDLAVISQLIEQLPDSLLDLSDPVVLIQHNGALKGYSHREGQLQPLNLVAIDALDIGKDVTVTRVRGNMALTCALLESEVTNVFKYLLEKVSSPYGAFHLENSDIHFLHTLRPKTKPATGWITNDLFQEDYTEDCTVTNVNCDPSTLTVDQLWKYVKPEKKVNDDDEDDDGFGIVPKPKGQSGSGKGSSAPIQKKETLNFRLMMKMCGEAVTSKTLNCAPIVNYENRDMQTVRIPIRLDALGVVSNSTKVLDLMEVLKGSIQRQIQDMASKVLSEFRSRKSVSLPEVFHSIPPPFGHFVTMIYTKSLTCGNLAQFRKLLHKAFLLKCERPIFRRMNAHIFEENRRPPGPLLDVHLGLKSPGTGGTVALVKGHYSYHHYLQDKFDDEGWGCAYRSLQTIISWFRYQGYVATPIPTHQQIQKCLVDIGDKEPSFIGSSQWIGSMEVAYVLDKSCSVQCKFKSVNSGSQLAASADELLYHFQSQGTPIMVGGGVLAHTLLGLAFNQDTDQVSFLVLDPHYTGSDWVASSGQSNLAHIQAKGWVGWKPASFWKKDAFYNLCMPQRPCQW